MTNEEKIVKALSIKFSCNAGDDITIKDYMFKILDAFWYEQESFSGKRPLGDSGWQYDLYYPLIKEGLVEGKIDEEYQTVEDVEDVEADTLIRDIIKYIFYPQTA